MTALDRTKCAAGPYSEKSAFDGNGGLGMSDEATRAVGVPPGVPVGWVAPDTAILDRGDLETMHDGLRAGKTVAIASDGHVYVSGEATGQPMTPEAQQFIESRLGVVKQLVEKSGGMTI